MKNIRFMSWNILAERFNNHPSIKGMTWETRLEKIKKVIEEEKPDIICLQEVELATFEGDFFDLFLHYNPVCNQLTKKRRNPIGNIILVHFSFTSDPAINGSSFLAAKIKDNHGETCFIVTNVHLKAGLKSAREVRHKQVFSLLKQLSDLRAPPETPVIICGDFNECISSPTSLIGPELAFHNFKLYSDLPKTCFYLDEKKWSTFEGSSEDEKAVFYSDRENWHSFDQLSTRECTAVFIKSLQNFNHVSIPNQDMPSDHLPLSFTVNLLPTKDKNKSCSCNPDDPNFVEGK